MGFFDNLFGGGNKSNPSNAAMPFLNQISGATLPYLAGGFNQSQQFQQPYLNAGQSSLPQLQGQYGSLLNNPGGKLNEIGGQFHESPGFKFALEQALGSLGRKENANGMYQSPEHEQHAMELATNLGNQDYYNWLNGATGLYNQGLSGEQGLASGGLQAGGNLGEGAMKTSGSIADMIAQALASQAGYSYAGQAAKNQQNNSLISNLIKGGGALAAFTPWGSSGSAAGTAFDRLNS